MLQLLGHYATSAHSVKQISEACHRVTHINFHMDVLALLPPMFDLKPDIRGHLKLCSLWRPCLPVAWLACLNIRWYRHRGFSATVERPEPLGQSFQWAGPVFYGDELLLTAQWLAQRIAKCKRSGRKWGLTLSRAGSHPSKGRPPVAMYNKAAYLLLPPLSLSAVFHHRIAHRRCRNSCGCVYSFSLYPWIQWKWLCLSWTMNGCPSGCLFIHPSLKYLRHCSLEFDKLRDKCARLLWLMHL